MLYQVVTSRIWVSLIAPVFFVLGLPSYSGTAEAGIFTFCTQVGLITSCTLVQQYKLLCSVAAIGQTVTEILRFFDFKDVDHPSVCHLVFSRTFRNFWKSKIADGCPSENRKIKNRDILVTVWPIAEKFVTVTNFILSNRKIWYDAKFALIGQTVTEILRYFHTQDGSCLLSWIFKNFFRTWKSKMAYGLHIENRNIIISRQGGSTDRHKSWHCDMFVLL